jgi:predicted DNA binding CopG/RHH family protein
VNPRKGKSFKDNNPAMQFINPQEAQQEQDTQEAQEVHLTHGTQGRKGQKLPRINMAFAQENLNYLQIIARIEGVSITEYVNRLVKADHAARADELERAKDILKGAE